MKRSLKPLPSVVFETSWLHFLVGLTSSCGELILPLEVLDQGLHVFLENCSTNLKAKFWRWVLWQMINLIWEKYDWIYVLTHSSAADISYDPSTSKRFLLISWRPKSRVISVLISAFILLVKIASISTVFAVLDNRII